MRFRVRALVISLVAALAVLPAGAASAISTATLQAKLDARDGPRRRVLGRLRARPRQPADPLRLQARRTAGPGIGREALHDGLRPACASDPMRRCPPRSPGRGFLDPDGVWRGDLYLRGGGDPTLGRDDLQRLAGAVGEAGILRVDGSVLGDESRFDRLRGSFDTRRRLRPRHRRGAGRADAQPGLLEGRKAGRGGGAAVRQGPARRRHPRRGPQRRPGARRPRRTSWPASPRRRCATSSG